MIEIKGVCFAYDDTPVLKDINLNIARGEWLAIIGPNGSGKSTLARQINGLLLPDSGNVFVDGLSVLNSDQLWQIRAKVAFVFQNPDNQLVATSVEDDIAFGPENLGLAPELISARVENALKITGLQQLRNKPPHLLSGGEKQRVAIAGALAMAAEYLIMDEPTSMLDPQLRSQVLAAVKQLYTDYQMGIVYVTNILEEAFLADRVIALADGAIVAQGTPTQIFADAGLISQLGLELPSICQIASLLADAGYQQLRGVGDIDQLVEALCKLS